jgi:hypothetical protein
MTDRFCTITPTRGDRPQLLEFCRHQLSRTDPGPEKSFFILDPPKLGLRDIVPRIRTGIQHAQNHGFDKVYVIEDDDFYPQDYFSQMAFDCDFVGTTQSTYYHLFNQTYETMVHPDRSSLYNTGFRISALKTFRFPSDDVAFLDLRLWKYCKQQFKKARMLDRPVGLGIKHGIGRTGGSGHRREFKRKDQDYSYLRSMVDKEAFDFYMTLCVHS